MLVGDSQTVRTHPSRGSPVAKKCILKWQQHIHSAGITGDSSQGASLQRFRCINHGWEWDVVCLISCLESAKRPRSSRVQGNDQVHRLTKLLLSQVGHLPLIHCSWQAAEPSTIDHVDSAAAECARLRCKVQDRPCDLLVPATTSKGLAAGGHASLHRRVLVAPHGLGQLRWENCARVLSVLVGSHERGSNLRPGASALTRMRHCTR